MVGNEERAMTEAARPNLANMTQAIMKPDITGHFDLKQYMVELIQYTGQYVGLSHKDLQRHIQNFLKITDTYNYPNVFKDYVQLNIPLVDILREIPKYAKYIKDITAHKMRLTEFETVALTEDLHSKQLDLGAPRPTTMMLQLTDRSIGYPKGVIEDVLLQIGKFIFPADFIILDYEADELVPIILGQPLLAIGDAIIKVKEEK
ncbi:uncharacterized protein LOC142166995 [Nicotiana tabacum]|uniref:Uncharacterized protein LOC142166995 n=1 Tax=Nicotiana tabacum TaxID=4097 RepID=A0AC58SE48_TOBAC